MSTINPSSTIVSTKRKLNAVIPSMYDTDIFSETEDFIAMGGRRLRLYALDSQHKTIPVIGLGGAVNDTKSAHINGNVYDISGSNGSYCLELYNTGRDTTPVRNIMIDSVRLPINQYGDVIFAYTPVPSPFENAAEDAVYWMGLPMRLVRMTLMDWMMVVNT